MLPVKNRLATPDSGKFRRPRAQSGNQFDSSLKLYDNPLAMLQNGILNPGLLELLARIRHTNTLVIADWAFPFWPQVETIDLSLTRGIPTILDLLELLQPNFKVGKIRQASEFLGTNPPDHIARFDAAFAGFPHATVERLPHLDFKKLVPGAIGLVRTGDSTAYGNVILESV